MAAGTRASEFLNPNSEREHRDALLRADAVPRVTFTDPQAAATARPLARAVS